MTHRQHILDALTSAYKRALMNRDAAQTLKAQSHWIDRLEVIATEYNRVLEE
jgi:hypothetical protein